MKPSKILTCTLLFISTIAFSQTNRPDSLIQYYYKYPRQAVEDAEDMYKKAIKEHNKILFINAIILKTTFSLQINKDEYPQLLEELENYVAQEKDINTKSILHLYTGKLYQEYYNQNRYKIDQRTALTGDTPKNIENWSGNLFNEKIFSHLLASISPQQTLQQTPVSTYQEILMKGIDSDSLCPTLYDFLCQQVIHLLRQNEYRRNASTVTFSSGILGDTKTFLQTPITVVPHNVPSNILKIWQDLIAFHKASGHTDALVMADLERLDYARRVSKIQSKDSIYLSTLRMMKKEYMDTPFVIEVMAKEANLLANSPFDFQPFSKEQQLSGKAAKEEALAICQEGLRLYPQYNRINLLREIIENIKAPQINVKFPRTIYSGENLSVKIHSKNINTVRISLYRVGMDLATYQNQKNKQGAVIPRTSIYQHDFPLAAEIIETDTTLQLQVPKAGLYEVVFKVKGAKSNLSDYFISTQIFTTCQRDQKQIQIQAYDWQSGKPMDKAKILFFEQSRRWDNYTVIDSAYTNPQGTLTWHPAKNLNSLFYQVTDANNPAGSLEPVSSPYMLDRKRVETELITDRKIYRPGQTVYFKGISWLTTPDTIHALDQKQYEVIFRDANYKEISKKKYTSNSFGSFSGSFVIPQQTLNGNFTLNCNNQATSITVADYKRPEFEITFTEQKQTYYTGDTIYIKGKVESFSGLPIANTPVNYELSTFSHLLRFPDPQNKIQGITHTDAKGEFSFQLIAQQPGFSLQKQSHYFYQFNVTLTDGKGETQQSSTLIPVFSGTAQPVITLPEQVNKNKKTSFRISLGEFPVKTASRAVYYSLAKLVSPSSLSQPQDTTIEKVISEGELYIHQQDSLTPNLRGLPSGAYLFTVECDKLKAKQIFYLYSDKDKRPPVPTYAWLIKEKTNCLPGETARIQFGTSVQNAYVRYQIYTLDKLLKQKDVVLSNEIINIDVPYSGSYGNSIWIYITYVKDKKYIEEIIPINLIRKERQLTIDTKVFRDKLSPGQEEQWTIRVINDKKQPLITEVLAMMYDASLDKLSPYPFNFQANYLAPGFLYTQNMPYSFDASNSLYLDSWHFKQQKLNIPGLRSNQFNLLEQLKNMGDVDVFTSVEYGSSPSTEASNRVMSKKAVAQTAIAQDIAQDIPSISLRQEFQETAFFYPQLQTDSTGNVDIKFKVPESLTKWKFIALATTKEMANTYIERYITTSKSLMVRPNLPRFLRNGDLAEIKVTISNTSDTLQQGVSTLELFQPGNNEIIFSQNEHFSITAGENQTVSFNFKVPAHLDLAGCRITASSAHFSDGEQHLLPILPDETLITETLPIYTTSAGEHTFSLSPSSPKRQDYRLTLEMTANPVWYAVLALPTLMEPAHENATDIAASYYVNTIASRIVRANPRIAQAIREWSASPDKTTLLSKLEQNSELKSILLEASPWVLQAQDETERMQTLSRLFDQNRLDYLQQQAFEKLASLQTPEGGWSWFKGMYPSRFMTFNILLTMAKANSTGEKEYGEKEKTMQIQALRYLDSEIRKDFSDTLKQIGYSQILYLYTRSQYRDIPLGEALNAHKYFMTLARKQWGYFSLYEKALISIAMKNYGFTQEAQQIINSLRQYAIRTPEMGMYWPNNQNDYYRNSAVQAHTAIMEAFQTVEGNTIDINLMKQWLLRQKQVQSWGNVPATVDAIYALLFSGNDQLSQPGQVKVKLGQYKYQIPADNNPLGYIKESYTNREIKSDMLTVQVDKQSPSPSWGGLYLQYFTKLNEVKGQQTDLSIDKKLFIASNGENGQKELIPLDRRVVKIGDQIIVRLTLSLNRDMEFLHVKDMRAACLEPVEQLSGNQWKFGTVYYQETKDAVTNFFFTALSKGTYVIEYPVWINQAGTYQDGIATLQSIYTPEFNAFSNATKLEVKN